MTMIERMQALEEKLGDLTAKTDGIDEALDETVTGQHRINIQLRERMDRDTKKAYLAEEFQDLFDRVEKMGHRVNMAITQEQEDRRKGIAEASEQTRRWVSSITSSMSTTQGKLSDQVTAHKKLQDLNYKAIAKLTSRIFELEENTVAKPPPSKDELKTLLLFATECGNWDEVQELAEKLKA